MRRYGLIYVVSAMMFFAGACTGHSGKTDTGNTGTQEQQIAGVYACPMHPEVVSDQPGDCTKCGMKLEKADSTNVPVQDSL